jgi:carbon monoxide dehydrogenase subunit G
VTRRQFDHELTVDAPPQRAWAVLTDVPRLVDWVDVLEAAQEVEPPGRYTAVLSDSMGPFRMRADLDVVVRDIEVGTFLALRADGEDRQVGSRLLVEVTMTISPRQDGGTTVRVAGWYEVTGRVAAMGTGSIAKKAQRILDDFVAHAGEALGER